MSFIKHWELESGSFDLARIPPHRKVSVGVDLGLLIKLFSFSLRDSANYSVLTARPLVKIKWEDNTFIFILWLQIPIYLFFLPEIQFFGTE